MFEQQISLKIQIELEEQYTTDTDPNACQLLFRLRMHQLREIFEFLPFQDLLNFRATSKQAYNNTQLIFEEQVSELDNNKQILDQKLLLVYSTLRRSYFTLEYKEFVNSYTVNCQFVDDCYLEWKGYPERKGYLEWVGYHRHNKDLFRKLELQYDFIYELMQSNYTLKQIKQRIKQKGIRKPINFMDTRQGIQSIKDRFIDLRDLNAQKQDQFQESRRKEIDDMYQSRINKIDKLFSILENQPYSRYVELVTDILRKLNNKKRYLILTKLLQRVEEKKKNTKKLILTFHPFYDIYNQ